MPITSVESPMSASEIIRVRLRPIRSPSRPKIRLPIGLAMKPNAKLANAASVPAAGLKDGKNR